MTAPLIWALTGRNAGDNAQALALAGDVAAAVGGAVVDIPLRFNLLREAPNSWLGASLASLTSAAPQGPWPDLVIGVGRRAVPVARWVRAQSGAAVVWLGRPRADTALFDLLLTTPQYGVPDGPNVVRLSLPYSPPRPDADPVAPLMVIGGDSWASRLTTRTIDNLAKCADAVAGDGRMRITSSPRTPDRFMTALSARFPDAEIHKFGQGENPYLRWLAEASDCIVTGDSISLIADAVATGATVRVARPDDARLIGALRSVSPAMTWKWLTEGGNREFLAPPPYPAAVIAHLVKTGAGRETDYCATIKDAKPVLTAEHRVALARATALIRQRRSGRTGS